MVNLLGLGKRCKPIFTCELDKIIPNKNHTKQILCSYCCGNAFIGQENLSWSEFIIELTAGQSWIKTLIWGSKYSEIGADLWNPARWHATSNAMELLEHFSSPFSLSLGYFMKKVRTKTLVSCRDTPSKTSSSMVTSTKYWLILTERVWIKMHATLLKIQTHE